MAENKESKKKEQFQATGRRKEAVARVKLTPEGKGRIVINGREAGEYFSTVNYRIQIKRPLVLADVEGKIDIFARVKGGGQSGQAGAVSLGISRCLITWNPNLRSVLKKENLLTRDPRAKERKKYGRKGARRRFQWTKR